MWMMLVCLLCWLVSRCRPPGVAQLLIEFRIASNSGDVHETPPASRSYFGRSFEQMDRGL